MVSRLLYDVFCWGLVKMCSCMFRCYWCVLCISVVSRVGICR